MEKRYDHQLAEQQARQLWQDNQTFTQENNPGPLFSIDTPPPTVSGSLHIGHIFSYSQTDIIARYKRMSGFSVFYPFGFDDNGLATERYVEKKLKTSAHKHSRSEFIKLCLQESLAAQGLFKDLWQRMGLSVDWRKLYSTIDKPAQKISQESFIRLFNDGHIYRKHEPALYCTTCRTSVAQAELDDEDRPSQFNDIVFKDEQGNNLVIGTTRPELLPSCVALLFNPQDPRYQHLRGTTATVPLFEHQVPVMEDELVEIEKGTGLVMVCTFGDKTDIVWFKKFNLPYKQSIGLDGKWTADTGPLAGMNATDARAKVLELLAEKGLLLNQRPISHSVNLHERCKKEIEYVALSQWFLNILDHKDQFLKLADELNWNPTFMKARYIDWVENLGWDWCLSRQRFYGIPFPVWHCGDCKKILLAPVEHLPIDPQESAYPGNVCDACGSNNILPETDVMDTWNTSSLTPQIGYELFNTDATSPFIDAEIKNFIPMSMRAQAHDIIRTWAFYTIIKSWFHHQTLPWKDIVISGHVLAGDKQKLSKSKENSAMTPESLLERYPADVIRYWTASGNLGHDVAFSEDQLKIGQRLITKIWNAFRFVHEHIANFEHPEQEPASLDLTNQWIMQQAQRCFEQYQTYLDQYEFGLALDAVEKFFWNDFCDNYLELVKYQLFNSEQFSQEEVRATRWTLYHTGLRILQLYAPFLPYVTENLYGLFYQKNCGVTSIAQTQFKKEHVLPRAAGEYDVVVPAMQAIIELVATARRLKTEQQLSLKTEFAILEIVSQQQATLNLFKQHETLIKGITHAQAFVYTCAQGSVSSLQEKDAAWHATIAA